MALYHLLKEHKIPFEVAHVNHRWCKEEDEIADAVQKICEQDHIPFHLKVLHLSGANLEDRCREERIAFFMSLSSCIVLGHHADDQAETVLKRVFEGAKLHKLKGLSVMSQRAEHLFYRPLLSVRKKVIVDWLEQRQIAFFEDKTNDDPKYLRNRMRQELMPLLSKQFGKEIAPSLCRLGQLSAELDEHLQKTCGRFEKGGVIDLSEEPPKSLFEWRAVVSYIFEREGLDPSSLFLDQVIFHLRNKSDHKHLRIKKRYVKLHRQTIEIS